jgi:hypothetical protein
MRYHAGASEPQKSLLDGMKVEEKPTPSRTDEIIRIGVVFAGGLFMLIGMVIIALQVFNYLYDGN